MPPHHHFNQLASTLLRVCRPQSNCPPSIVPATSSVSLHAARLVTTPSRAFSSSPTLMEGLKTKEPIHILGLGNLGKLFAHALTTSKTPSPVTILTHRPGLPYAFEKSGSAITILRKGVETSTPPGYVAIEAIKEDDKTPIQHLIVTTKAANTASALLPLIPRLTPDSTILFTQNGMGIIDSVNTLCFPDPFQRPTYLTAIVVHGVFNTGPFSATHAAVADMKIGFTPNGSSSPYMSSGAQELLDKIVAADALVATEVDPKELIAVQLEKLIANACINPLTVIFRTPNGGLLDPRIAPLRRILCREARRVFINYLISLNYLKSLPANEVACELRDRFNARRLEGVVKVITNKTRKNKSSMLQDFEAGRETEVRWINGWIVEKGKEYGVDCSSHERLVQLVEEKRGVRMEDVGSVFEKTESIRGARERRSAELFGFLKE